MLTAMAYAVDITNPDYALHGGLLDGQVDLTLKVGDNGRGTAELQLVDVDRGNLIVAEAPLTDAISVNITGYHTQIAGKQVTFPESLVIDLSNHTALTPAAENISVTFDGFKDVNPLTKHTVTIAQPNGIGNGIYSPSGLNVTLINGDQMTVSGAVPASGYVNLTSDSPITVTGSITTSGDITLSSTKTLTTDGTADSLDPLNMPSTSIAIDGGTLSGKNVNLSAHSTATVTISTATALSGQLSVGEVVVNSNASVLVDGTANITATGKLGINAISDVTTNVQRGTDSTGKSGDTKTQDAAVSASVVVTHANVTIKDTAMLSAGDTIGIAALNNVNVTTLADGQQGNSSAGAVVAVSTVESQTNVDIDDNASITAAHDMSLSATTNRTVNTKAIATTSGATDSGNANNPTVAQQRLADPDGNPNTNDKASTSDGDVKLAAVVAVHTLTGSTQANISGGSLTSTSGNINVLTSMTHDVTTTADGTPSTGGNNTGVGVAIGVGAADVSNKATISGNVTLHANNVNVNALTNPSTFKVEAKSGKSGDAQGANTTVAGALAVNVAVVRTEAVVATGAVLDLQGSNLQLQGQSTTNTIANATPVEDAIGKSLGIGASVATHVNDMTTRAVIESGTTLSNAKNLSLTATSDNSMNTHAKAGARGGTAVGASVAVAIAHHDTIARIESDNTSPITTTGDVSLTATHTGHVITLSEGDAKGVTEEPKKDQNGNPGSDAQGQAAIGAAVSLNYVVDETRAELNRSLTTTNGAITLAALQAATSQSTAKASAKGDKDKGQGSANNQAANQRGSANSAASSRGARDSSGASANPSASTSEGDISIAAGIALNIANTTSSAAIANGITVQANKQVSVTSAANTDASAVGDGSAVGGKDASVGAAIAINLANVNNLATIGSGAHVTSDGLVVTATMRNMSGDMTHTLGATSVSGAGGSGVGVAGSFAMSIDNVDTEATIQGGAFVTLADGNDGGVFVGLTDIETSATTSSVVSATASENGQNSSDLGVGASVALNIVNQKSHAAIEESAVVNGAQDLTLKAVGDHTVTTTAAGGAAGGSVTLTPVVAIALDYDNVDARIGIQNGGTLSATGAMSVSSTSTGNVKTDAKGNASGASDAAIGASLGLSVVNETATATTARNLSSGGSMSFSAVSSSVHETNAVASASGAKGDKDNQQGNGGSGKTVQGQVDDQRGLGNTQSTSNGGQSSGTDNKATATTADKNGNSSGDAITVAAAVAVSILNTNANAEIGDGLTITSGGLLTVHSSQNSDGKANASGAATQGKDGIAAAVAINIADVGNHARIGSSTVTADGLAVEAVMTPVAGEAVSTHSFRADALSGAAGKDVGVAGSLAINLASVKTSATIDSGANITLADGADAGSTIGPVKLSAVSTTSNIVNALPVQLPPNGDTPSDGIGASVALNLVYDDTSASIADGVTWSGGSASSLTVSSTANHTMTTEAKNGGKGGDVGIGGAVAVVIAKNNTTAYVGTGTGAINSTGAISVIADHASATNTKVSSAATGSDAAIGASVGINLVTENVTADVARDVTTGGSVSIKSKVEVAGTVDVKASAAGGDSNGNDSDTEANNQANQPNATTDGANSTPKSKDNAKGANDQSKSESDSSGGGVGIAASVGVNALSIHNTAQISHGADVTATGAVSVSAPAHVVARTTSDSSTVDLNGDVNIGAAVSLNVASLTNSALVGTDSTVTGNGITVEAITPANQTNDYTATAYAVAGNDGDVAVSGVAAINVVNANTTAMTADGSSLVSTGDVNVTANHHLRAQAAAIAGAFSSEVAVAPALAINWIGQSQGNKTGGANTIASIGDPKTDGAGASVSASGAVNVSADYSVGMFPILDLPESLNNPSDPNYSSFAIQDINQPVASIAISGGGSSGTVAVAASVGINLLESTTQAVVDDKATVNGASLSVHANDVSNTNSLAGSVGLSTDGAGIGAGLDLGIVHKHTLAEIGKSTHITTTNAVNVTAGSTENVISGAANAGGGDSLGIAGSASVQVIDTSTKAEIASGTSANDGATVNAGGSVGLTANDSLTLKMLAGAVGVGGSGGVGASNTTLVHTGDVEATVGDWTNLSAGNTGLSVVATSNQEYVTIAAAGGAAGTVGAAGAAVVNVLDETTIASIGRNATITTSNGALPGTPGVTVTATDTTLGVSVAGSLAAAGTASAGIGADVAKVTKDTEAFIDSNVTATVEGDIVVKATSTEQFTSVAAGLAAGGSVGVSLDASVHVLDLTTRAFIGDDPNDQIASAGAGDVHAQGNVVVGSDDQVKVDNVVGVIAASGTVAVAGGAAVTTTNKHTEAFIGKGAKVTADGKTPAISVPTGRFLTSYVVPANSATPGIESNSSATVNASAGDLTASGQVGLPSTGSTDINRDGKNDATSQGLSGKRTLVPEMQNNFQGLSVTALNRDEIADYSISFSAGEGAIAISAGVNVLNNQTLAYIGQGAAINQNLATAGNAQSVNVAAGSDFGHVAFAGSATGGVVGISPAASVTVANNTTEAYFGWDEANKVTASATVNAKNDVTVEAHATEDALLVGVGLGGGAVGIGAGLDVLVVNDHTQAAIGQNATVSAAGDVVVEATDDTSITIISGGGGGGLVGLGGAVGVTTVTKETNAWIDTGATVDAGGAGAGVSDVLNGTTNAAVDGFVKTTGHGVVVQASSTEDLFHMAVAVGGGYVGVAGGVTVSLLDSNTSAEIKDNAQINQTMALPNTNQSVYVNAANHANVVTFAGALAGGVGGVAGGVDYGTLKNDTLAGIGANANVSAKDDVSVNALGIKKLNGIAFSGALGGAALAGTVSDWSIGTPLKKDYSDNDGNSANAGEADKKDGGQSADDNAAGQADAGRGMISSQLNAFQAPPNANPKGNTGRMQGITGAAASKLTSNAPSQSALDTAINSGAASAGTSAFIGAGSAVTAVNNISVKADEHVNVDITVGGVSAGVVSGGAAIGVLDIAANTSALSAGTLSAGGTVDVSATLNETVNGTALAGGMGAAFGIGAAVYQMHDNSKVESAVGSVMSASAVNIVSDATQTLHLTTGQADQGAAALGASFTRVTDDGSVTATVLGGSQIGQKAGQSVGSLNVQATSNVDAHNTTGAVSAGAVAVNANFAFVTVKPTVTANVQNGSSITVKGNASVEAIADHNALTEVITLSGGLGSLGASISQATLDATVGVDIAGGVGMTAGSITLEARNNHDGTNATGDNAKAVAAAPSVALAGAGSGTVATTKASTDVSTHVGAGSALTSTKGAVSIRSFNADSAEGDAMALSIGLGAAIGASVVTVDASGNTSAQIEGSVTSKTSLTVSSTAANTATANAETGTGGIAGGAGATTTATANPSVQATIVGQGVINATSTTLQATSNNQALANSNGTVVGGLVGVGVIKSVAHTDGSTLTFLSEEAHGGNVTVDSESTNTAHATSIAATGGIGGVGNAVTAHIESKPQITSVVTAKVNVTGPVTLKANSTTDASAIAHSVTIAAGVSGGNSVATLVSMPNVNATVQAGGITTPSSLLTITANDTSTINSDAGSSAGGLVTAVGTGVAHNTVKGTVLAGIEKGSDEVGSLAITATENATINAKAVGIAVSGGISLAGGEAVNDIANNVKAHIFNDVFVNAHGDVAVNAQDTSTIAANVDQTSGGLVGGGTAESINNIANQVEASVQHLAQVKTTGNVLLTSSEDATIREASVGASGGFVGISGNVAINTLANSVKAFIDDKSDVEATKSVLVFANAENSLTADAANTSVGAAGIGGTVVVNTFDNTTQAFVNGSTVIAKGSSPSIPITRWDENTGQAITQNLSGLAVIASSVEHPAPKLDPNDPLAAATVRAFNFSGGLAGLSGISVVDIVNDHTDAFIASSNVNAFNNPGGDVIVRAHSDQDVTVLSGGAAVGFAGVGGNLDRTEITSVTRAFISDNIEDGKNQSSTPSTVFGSNIDVDTVSLETISATLRGVSGGGLALAGAVSIEHLDTTNQAFIKNSNVYSIGDLKVRAHDSSAIDPVDPNNPNNGPGVTSVAFGGFSGGAAVSLNTIENTVQARVMGSDLAAKGATSVTAGSAETINATAKSEAVGAISMSGAVTVDTITTTTEATVVSNGGTKSTINQTPLPGGGVANSSVAIGADDQASITSQAGNVAVGMAGFGASVDVGSIRNRTIAKVGQGTVISADHNVDITAHSDHSLDSSVAAGSLGAIGLSGAVSYLSLGAAQSKGASTEFNQPSQKDPNTTLLSQMNQNVKNQDVSKGVGNDPLATAASNRVNTLSNPDVGGAIDANLDVTDRKTAAFVEDAPNAAAQAKITAGGHVNITATHNYSLTQSTGSDTKNLAGFGAAISVSNINDTTQAFLGNQDVINAQGDVTIQATDAAKSPIDVKAYSGAVGVIDIAFNVADVTLTTNTTASVGNNAQIQRGADVSVKATQSADMTVNANGFAFGAFGGAGADKATPTVITNTTASVNDGAKIGNVSNVGSLTVSANATNNVTAGATVGSVSLGPVANGGGAIVNITPTIVSQIGNDTVNSTGSVNVFATTTNTATTTMGAFAVGVSAEGASVAKSTIAGSVTAQVSPSATITTTGASGQVFVQSNSTNTASATASATNVGLVGGNASETLAKIDVDSLAQIGTANAGATVNAQGAIRVESNSTNKADADSEGTTVGIGAAKGLSKADAVVEGSTRSFGTGNLTSTGDFIRVQALDTKSHAVATVTAAGGGLIGSLQGATANASIAPSADDNQQQVRARLAGTIKAHGDIAVRAKSTDDFATATGHGVTIAGGASGGSTNATSTLNQSFRSSIGDGSTVTSDGDVKVEAMNLAGVSTSYASNSGGSLVDSTGSVATANATGDVAAVVGNAVITAMTGTLHVVAKSVNVASANADGIAIGILFGKGNTSAVTNVGSTDVNNPSTEAGISDNANLTLGSLDLNALEQDQATTVNTGSGGGTITDQSTNSAANVAPNVSAYIGDNVNATTTGDVTIASESQAEADASAQANTGGLGSIGATDTKVNVTPIVMSTIGQNAHLTVKNDFSMTAKSGKGHLQGGDGVSTATANGYSAAGFIGKIGGAASVVFDADVESTVKDRTSGGKTIDATHDLNIGTDSTVNVGSSSVNGSIGIAGGAGAVTVAGDDVDNTSKTNIGNGVQLSAGHDLTLSSQATHVADAHSSGFGLGGITMVTTNNYVDIDYHAVVAIGENAVLTAGGNLSATTSSSNTATTNTSSGGGGAGVSMSANTRKNNGDNYDNNNGQLKVGGSQAGVRIGQVFGAISQVEVKKNASLTADSLTLKAVVASTHGESITSTSGSGGGGDANSLSRVELEDQATVIVHAGASLNATHDVNLVSDIEDVYANTVSTASFTGALGFAYAYAIGDLHTNATVTTEDTSSITTHNLNVQALVDSAAVQTAPGNDDQFTGAFSPDRNITFDSDVLLTSGSAILIIGPNGNVIQQEGVTFTTTPTNIIVQPIVNDHPGTATFETNSVSDVVINGVTQTAPLGLVSSAATISKSAESLFTFRETLDEVHIENQSSKGLIMNSVQVVNSTKDPQIVITSDLDKLFIGNAWQDAIGYNLKQTFAATPVSILETTHNSADITISGLIDNPIGTTQIVNNGGSILQGNNGDIRTNILNMDAHKDVGSAASLLKVDLVASAGHPTGGTTTAQGDVWLDVKGINRDTPSANYVFDVGTITGKNTNVYMEPGIQQTTLGNGFTAQIDNFETQPGTHTYRNFHFRDEQAGNLNLPLGIFGTGNSAVQSTYKFDLVKAQGGNINLSTPSAGATVNFGAYTDVVGNGVVNAQGNGSISAIETVGDLQIGTIFTPFNVVGVSSMYGNIVDQENDAKADIIATSIVLVANNGSIGTLANPIEIDSSFHNKGLVTAKALNGIYLTETAGDLNVGKITSYTGDVYLVTNRGSILDGNNDAGVDIQGVNISLTANLGDIGAPNNYLDVWSSNPTPGKLTAVTTGGNGNQNNIWINNFGAANIQLVQANGSVSISSANGADLNISSNGLVVAKKQINMNIGGNITLSPGSMIQSDSSISLIAGANANNPVSTMIMHLGGNLAAPYISIGGGDSNDQFFLNGQFNGQTTVVGKGGNDQFFLTPGNQIVGGDFAMMAAVIVPTYPRSMLLDGGEGSDSYTIQLGTLAAPVTINDSGRLGTDSATVNGTDANELFTVANTNANGASQTGGYARTAASGQAVNYGASLENLTVQGQRGSDTFQVQPSQTTNITIDGGPSIGAGDLDVLKFNSFGLPVARSGSTLLTSGGHPSNFLPVQTRNIDITPPTATVNPLPAISTSKTITLTVTLSDKADTANQPATGVATYDVYVSIDGGAWTRFAQKIPASQTQVNFVATSNHRYAFRAVATDFAGNVEIEGTGPLAEATTQTPDFDAPQSQVTSVTAAARGGTFNVAVSATDTGGAGLQELRVFVAIDGGAAQQITGSPIKITSSSPPSTYRTSLSYAGIRDGKQHTYRFFTIAVDAQGNTEAAPAPTAGVTVQQTF